MRSWKSLSCSINSPPFYGSRSVTTTMTSRACCEDSMWPSLIQSTTSHPIYLISNLITLTSFLWPVFPRLSFLWGFMTKIYKNYWSLPCMLWLYPIHLILLDYVILTLFSAKYKLQIRNSKVLLLVENYLGGQLIWPAFNVLDDRTRIIIQESSLLKGREEQGLNFYLKTKYGDAFIRNTILLSVTYI